MSAAPVPVAPFAARKRRDRPACRVKARAKAAWHGRSAAHHRELQPPYERAPLERPGSPRRWRQRGVAPERPMSPARNPRIPTGASASMVETEAVALDEDQMRRTGLL